MSLPQTEFVIGIDGGGTKCKAVIGEVTASGFSVLAEGIAGPANAFSHSELAKNSVIDAVKMALVNANLPEVALSKVSVAAGMAGVNVKSALLNMQQWQHPFRRFHVTHDLHIACLAAHQAKDGVVLVAGTGSCGFSLIEEKQITLGGHGFPQGDKASGAWFGLRVVESVLLSLDGVTRSTQMTKMLFTQLQLQSGMEIVERVAGQSPTFYAQLAFIVFSAAEQGDVLAKQIIDDGVSYLSQLMTVLNTDETLPVAILGGLAQTLYPYFSEKIKNSLKLNETPAEIGALLLAHQLWHTG